MSPLKSCRRTTFKKTERFTTSPSFWCRRQDFPLERGARSTIINCRVGGRIRRPAAFLARERAQGTPCLPSNPVCAQHSKGRRVFNPSPFWCRRQDLNLHGLPRDSKSRASANSATAAHLHDRHYSAFQRNCQSRSDNRRAAAHRADRAVLILSQYIENKRDRTKK